MLARTLLLVVLGMGIHSSATSANPEDFVGQQKITSHLIVNLFLEQLNGNEIILFDQRISRADLVPKRVSFSYQLQTDKLCVEIYNDLIKPLPLPQQDSLAITGISVNVDENGVIGEVKAHVKSR